MPKQPINHSSPDLTSPLLLSFFFLSGFSGLIYEILWTRMTVAVIGSAPFAVTIVLTIFMGGLGAGSYIAGRFIDRMEDPLSLVKLYGVLELIVGGYALLVPILMKMLRPLQAVVYNRLYDHFIPYHVLTFAVCAVLLSIPVVCMGATLPILCRFYVSRLSHLGTHAGRLYGLNTIGAALGALACGFWFIDRLGVYGTLALAVGVNLFIGTACIWMSRKTGTRDKSPQKPPPAVKKGKTPTPAENDLPAATTHRKSALALFAVSGFCAMACEVIWTRLLGVIVGPTTFSFTIVLVTFITGLALGSIVFGSVADRVKDHLKVLVITQIAAALLVLAVSQVLGNSQMFFAKMIYTFKDQFGLLNFVKAACLFGFMLLPTIFFGATFPLVNKIVTASISRVGRSIGHAYMINTLGSLSGAFCGGFLIIPLLGKERGIGVVVGLQIVTALTVAGLGLKGKHKNRYQLVPVSLAALAGLVLCFFFPAWDHLQLSTGKYHRFDRIDTRIRYTGWLDALFRGTAILSRNQDGELVYYGEGIGGFTTVVKYKDPFGNPNFTMANNGKPDATSRGDMATQTLLAHLPMLIHPGPERVMIIGLASGVTAGEVLLYPVDAVDVLEISDQVVEASDFFIPWNNRVRKDPRTNLIIQDARAHVLLTDRRYDVIISEPSNPWMAGLSALFTLDYFSLVKERLTDNGIFVQWMHAYQMDWETFSLVGRTFSKIFPNSLVVKANPGEKGGDYLFVGFGAMQRPAALFPENKQVFVRKSKNVTLVNPDLLYRLIVSDNPRAVFGTGHLNTDNRPRLEFAAPRLMYSTGDEISEIFRSHRANGLGEPMARRIESLESDVDRQIDFAAYALSVHAPFRNMVDLSRADPVQKERLLGLTTDYCTDNKVDYAMVTDDESRQRCLDIQIRGIENRQERLSDNFASLAYLAELYATKGMASKAVAIYEGLLQKRPDAAPLHNNMGAALAKLGRLDAAQRRYQEAIRLDPQYLDAYYNLGFTLEKLGKYDAAAAQYTRTLQVDPGHNNAANNLGIVLARQGKQEQAVAHYISALKVNPKNSKAHFNLGLLLARQGRHADAVDHLTETVGITPGHSEAHFTLGQIRSRQGDHDAAVNHFEKALAVNPDDARFHYHLGMALMRQGKTGEAIARVTASLDIHPDNGEAQNNLGLMLVQQGRIDDAVIRYKTALTINPDTPETLNNLGVALAEKGLLDQAIGHYGSALKLNPEYADAYNNLGVAYARLGKIEKAVDLFKKALVIQPGFDSARNNLDRAVRQMGRSQGAKAIEQTE